MIRLLELRTEFGLSQRDMARKMNVSQGTYNNWENSNTQPSIEQLIALADFFDVSVDYLIGRTNETESFEPRIMNETTAIAASLFGVLDGEAKEIVLNLLNKLSKK